MSTGNKQQTPIVREVFSSLLTENTLHHSQILLIYLQAKEEYRHERGIPIRHEYQHIDEAYMATDEQLYIAKRMLELYRGTTQQMTNY